MPFTIAPGRRRGRSGDYTIRLDSRRPAAESDRVMQDPLAAHGRRSLERAGGFGAARSMFERALKPE